MTLWIVAGSWQKLELAAGLTSSCADNLLLCRLFWGCNCTTTLIINIYQVLLSASPLGSTNLSLKIEAQREPDLAKNFSMASVFKNFYLLTLYVLTLPGSVVLLISLQHSNLSYCLISLESYICLSQILCSGCSHNCICVCICTYVPMLLDEAQAGIKISGRNINYLIYADDTTLMAENKEELKSLLKVKEGSEKAGLKLSIQKTKIMASGPITACQIDGETMEMMTHFVFLGSKITEDGVCSHKIKRHLLLGKTITNLDSVLKSRDITLPTKVHLVTAMFFPVVVYGCESWTVKKAERQRIDAFELWYWRRLLRVPWLQEDQTLILRKSIMNIH